MPLPLPVVISCPFSANTPRVARTAASDWTHCDLCLSQLQLYIIDLFGEQRRVREGADVLSGVAAAGKAMVIGLDCAEPSLVERWRDDLPTARRALRAGPVALPGRPGVVVDLAREGRAFERDRRLAWEGCFNGRDLGGLPTCDGRRTATSRRISSTTALRRPTPRDSASVCWPERPRRLQSQRSSMPCGQP